MKYVFRFFFELFSVSVAILAIVWAAASAFGFTAAAWLFVFCLPGLFAHSVIAFACNRGDRRRSKMYSERKRLAGY